jgi:hypothetical protein
MASSAPAARQPATISAAASSGDSVCQKATVSGRRAAWIAWRMVSGSPSRFCSQSRREGLVRVAAEPQTGERHQAWRAEQVFRISPVQGFEHPVQVQGAAKILIRRAIGRIA